MSRRKHKRASDRVMQKLIRGQFPMTFNEWFKRFASAPLVTIEGCQ